MKEQARVISEKYCVNEDEAFSALNKIKNKESILFAMSGKMGSGKDTIGDKISNHIDYKDYVLISTSYATPLREEIMNVTELIKFMSHSKIEEKYNVSIDKVKKLYALLDGDSVYDRTSNARRAIQYWGTDVRRKQNYNYWANKIVDFTIKTINNNKSVYITDVRFPNEAESVIDLGGKVIRLDVPSVVSSARILNRDGVLPTYEELTHSSETSLDDFEFDKVFDGCESPESIVNKARKYISDEK